MFFIYRPEDGETQEWWFEPKKFPSHEAEAVEKRTGWDWEEFGMHLVKGSALARRALLWVLLRRQHAVLRFEDVRFAMGEIELEYSVEELQTMRDQLQQLGDRGIDEVQLAAFDQQIDRARPGPGKAPASSGG